MDYVVLDDRFDSLFLEEFYRIICSIPLTQENIANRYTWPYGHKGTHKLQGRCIYERVDLNRTTVLNKKAYKFLDVFDLICATLQKKLYLSRIDINVQHKGADGVTHVDSKSTDDLTILMMANPHWNPEWGGAFQIMNEDESTVQKEHEYLPGRMIMFPGTIPHRGLAPTVDYVYRYSVVWRVTPWEVFVDRVNKQKVSTPPYQQK